MSSLSRAVLVKTDSGEGQLFSPMIAPAPADLGKTWSFSLPAARRVPVVCETADPRRFRLVDNPEYAPAPSGIQVRGVVLDPEQNSPIVGPSPVELTCAAPNVGAYLASLQQGALNQLDDGPDAPLLQAFALRVEQLSRHELDRIVRLARQEITPALLDHIRRIGPGMEYSAMPIYTAFGRFHDTNRWPEKIISATYTAVAHVAAARFGADDVTSKRLARRLDEPALQDSITTLLRPWVTVCGPIPKWDASPLTDPELPYSPREERPAGMPPTHTPSRPAPDSQPTHHHSRPKPKPVSAQLPAPSAKSARWRPWRRSASQEAPYGAAAHLLWNASIDRHDAVLRDYLPYEVDPTLILDYPAASDVQVTTTQAFHDASERASALRTDTGPIDSAHADTYREAVGAIEKAWQDAKSFARQTGRSYLDTDEARDLGRISHLLQYAVETSGSESESYRMRARDILSRYPQRTTPRARLSLQRAVRGELTSGR